MLFRSYLVVDTSGGLGLACGLTNTLWESGMVRLGTGTTGSGVTVHLRNNLFRQGSLDFYGGNTNWTVRDNLFDTMARLTNNGSVVQNCTNAYYATAYGLTGGQNNLLLSGLTNQTGPLGKYYQPTNSSLLNAGSGNAANAGLYHFTTTTNQVKETNSVVDIGLHYVAVDASGNPLDADGDGIPDYFEDANGNGQSDDVETPWQQYTSLNGLGVGTNPKLQVFTPLK